MLSKLHSAFSSEMGGIASLATTPLLAVTQGGELVEGGGIQEMPGVCYRSGSIDMAIVTREKRMSVYIRRSERGGIQIGSQRVEATRAINGPMCRDQQRIYPFQSDLMKHDSGITNCSPGFITSWLQSKGDCIVMPLYSA